MDEVVFNVNDLQLTALVSGPEQAPVILALHGWLDNAASFNLLRQHFSDYRFVALDLPGHGFSSHRPANMPYYIWDNLSEVEQVIQQLGGRVHLIGHSMGASVALLSAAVFPEQVAGLFLIEGLAPMVYSADSLPAQMGEAIKKRHKMLQKQLRPYPNIAAAITARTQGRWPVSQEAAGWLVERGVKSVAGGVIWRSDPGLMLPSILRMDESQVAAFLRAVTADVRLYLGQEGLWDQHWQQRMALVRSLTSVTLAGNHHLHLYPEPAQAIAEDIRAHL